MKIKKIENNIKTLDDIALDTIKSELGKDGYTFDNDEVTYEGMPDIYSEKDKIKYIENSEIVYYSDDKIYAIHIDEVGDYSVVDFKIRKEIQEYIK